MIVSGGGLKHCLPSWCLFFKLFIQIKYSSDTRTEFLFPMNQKECTKPCVQVTCQPLTNTSYPLFPDWQDARTPTRCHSQQAWLSWSQTDVQCHPHSQRPKRVGDNKDMGPSSPPPSPLGHPALPVCDSFPSGTLRQPPLSDPCQHQSGC